MEQELPSHLTRLILSASIFRDSQGSAWRVVSSMKLVTGAFEEKANAVVFKMGILLSN